MFILSIWTFSKLLLGLSRWHFVVARPRPAWEKWEMDIRAYRQSADPFSLEGWRIL